MTKYGKIYIEANTIEEAERDLAMIKAFAEAGAVRGQGSSALGMASAEIVGQPTAPQKPCGTCWCCKGNECDYYEDEDEDCDPYGEIADILVDLANGYISPSTALERITDIIADL